MNVQSIHEDAAMDHGYEEAAPTKGNRNSIRVSALPKEIQASARKLDIDGDGALEAGDVGMALGELKQTKKDNRGLKKTVAAFVSLSAILLACIFAATITAARLSKDTNVSPVNGFAYVKGSESNQVMKTAEALERVEGTNVGSLSNDDLDRLAHVVFMDGMLKFNVNGYSRGDPTSIENSEKIMLLVEGGTITYDDAGIIGSTGNAKTLLEFAFGPDIHNAGSDGERRLMMPFTYAILKF